MPSRYNLRKRGGQSTTWVKDETLQQPDSESESEDEDYVPEEDDDDDVEEEEEEDEEEFDPYSMKQKVAFLEQQITNIFSFLQKQFPKQKVMAASM